MENQRKEEVPQSHLPNLEALRPLQIGCTQHNWWRSKVVVWACLARKRGKPFDALSYYPDPLRRPRAELHCGQLESRVAMEPLSRFYRRQRQPREVFIW